MRSKEDTEYLEMFGARLKKMREERNWSQSYLGEQLGLTKSAIHYYERAKREPTLSVIRDLSQVFGVSPSIVLCEDELKKQCAKCS